MVSVMATVLGAAMVLAVTGHQPAGAGISIQSRDGYDTSNGGSPHRPAVDEQLAGLRAPEEEGCLLSKMMGPGATVEMSFSDQRFLVPAPYVNSFTPTEGSAGIIPRWPSFGPVCGTKPAEGVGKSEWYGDLLILVEDIYARLPLEERLRRQRRVVGPRVPDGTAFGLVREAPGPGSDPYTPLYLYTGRDSGNLDVVIDCGFVPGAAICHHIFETAAGSIQVSYSANLLPHWRDIQYGIVSLFEHWKK